MLLIPLFVVAMRVWGTVLQKICQYLSVGPEPTSVGLVGVVVVVIAYSYLNWLLVKPIRLWCVGLACLALLLVDVLYLGGVQKSLWSHWWWVQSLQRCCESNLWWYKGTANISTKLLHEWHCNTTAPLFILHSQQATKWGITKIVFQNSMVGTNCYYWQQQ